MLLKRAGFISIEESKKSPNGTPFLRYYNFYESHESGSIDAEPTEIISAVADLDMRDDKVADVLLSIRELPVKIIGIFRRKNLKKKITPFGFNTFTLLHKSSHELSLGLAGRFWRPDLVISNVSNAQDFKLLDDPKAAKLVLRFQVIEHLNYKFTLKTETFVCCSTNRVKILFTPYWLAIRLVSGWIRRRTLTSIQEQLSMKKHKLSNKS